MANQEHVEILKQGAEVWNQWRGENPNKAIQLIGADLSGIDTYEREYQQINLEGADLHGLDLSKSNFTGAILQGAILNDSNLSGANLYKAKFYDAKLINADLRWSTLTKADFSLADLTGADLQFATMVETLFPKAILSNAMVYGISAWGLQLKDTIQKDLIITPHGQAEVTVDNIEVAQFIYLLLNNEKIRGAIDTIGRKGVLILGRFTKERKDVLNAIRDKLRDMGFVPMLFDFDKPTKKDLTETVQLLANMSKFVIADITDAKSIPQELSHIIPFFPSVPVQPIILSSVKAYAMFEHWKHFNSVLPVFKYDHKHHLLDNFQTRVIQAVENWDKERDEIERLKARIRELEEQREKK